jgi:nitroreductase
MSLLDTIRSRRSVRDFKDEAIPDDVIDALIEAVRWAPSAGNLQSRKFYFVLDEGKRKQLARAALGQSFVARAPLVIVGCMDRRIASRYGDRGVNLYAIQDVAASVMSMMLMASELGLGTCWVGAFNEFDVVESLDLPDHLRPVAIIPIGYPSKVPKPTPRMDKDQVAAFVT